MLFTIYQTALGKICIWKGWIFLLGYHLGDLSNPSPDSNLSMIDDINFRVREERSKEGEGDIFKHHCLPCIDEVLVESEELGEPFSHLT